MTPLFTKLNLGEHRTILVVGAPASFDEELDALEDVTVLRKTTKWSAVTFVIFFVQTLKDVAKAANALPKIPGDPVVWFAYPKGTSKNYSCEFNRDTGWRAVGDAGFEGVRQVAIDDDWSALRFRRIDYIKSMTRSRSHAIPKKAKSRTKRAK